MTRSSFEKLLKFQDLTVEVDARSIMVEPETSECVEEKISPIQPVSQCNNFFKRFAFRKYNSKVMHDCNGSDRFPPSLLHVPTNSTLCSSNLSSSPHLDVNDGPNTNPSYCPLRPPSLTSLDSHSAKEEEMESPPTEADALLNARKGSIVTQGVNATFDDEDTGRYNLATKEHDDGLAPNNTADEDDEDDLNKDEHKKTLIVGYDDDDDEDDDGNMNRDQMNDNNANQENWNVSKEEAQMCSSSEEEAKSCKSSDEKERKCSTAAFTCFPFKAEDSIRCIPRVDVDVDDVVFHASTLGIGCYPSPFCGAYTTQRPLSTTCSSSHPASTIVNDESSLTTEGDTSGACVQGLGLVSSAPPSTSNSSLKSAYYNVISALSSTASISCRSVPTLLDGGELEFDLLNDRDADADADADAVGAIDNNEDMNDDNDGDDEDPVLSMMSVKTMDPMNPCACPTVVDDFDFPCMTRIDEPQAGFVNDDFLLCSQSKHELTIYDEIRAYHRLETCQDLEPDGGRDQQNNGLSSSSSPSGLFMNNNRSTNPSSFFLGPCSPSAASKIRRAASCSQFRHSVPQSSRSFSRRLSTSSLLTEEKRPLLLLSKSASMDSLHHIAAVGRTCREQEFNTTLPDLLRRTEASRRRLKARLREAEEKSNQDAQTIKRLIKMITKCSYENEEERQVMLDEKRSLTTSVYNLTRDLEVEETIRREDNEQNMKTVARLRVTIELLQVQIELKEACDKYDAMKQSKQIVKKALCAATKAQNLIDHATIVPCSSSTPLKHSSKLILSELRSPCKSPSNTSHRDSKSFFDFDRKSTREARLQKGNLIESVALYKNGNITDRFPSEKHVALDASTIIYLGGARGENMRTSQPFSYGLLEELQQPDGPRTTFFAFTLHYASIPKQTSPLKQSMSDSLLIESFITDDGASTSKDHHQQSSVQFLYGYSLLFPFIKSIEQDPHRPGHQIAVLGTMGFCIYSQFPFIALFRDVLRELFRTNYVQIDTRIKHLLKRKKCGQMIWSDTSKQLLRTVYTQQRVSENRLSIPVPGHLSPPLCLPENDRLCATELLAEVLAPWDMCKHAFMDILAAFMLERKILVLSDDIFLGSALCVSLQGLITPFQWRHVFQPFMPDALTKEVPMVDAPFPWIMNLHASSMAVIDTCIPRDVVVSTVKKGEPIGFGNIDLEAFPTKLPPKLLHTLRNTYSFDHFVSVYFDIMTSVHASLSSWGRNGGNQPMSDVKAFLKTHKLPLFRSSDDEFLLNFFSTQMCAHVVDTAAFG